MGMRLALESPVELLDKIQPLADFDWILAHLTVNSDYAEYYKKSRNFKVLDNSVNELLVPFTLGHLEEAASYIQPDLIVSPDYLGESERTLIALRESLKMFGLARTMPVVQGSDLSEVLHCFKEICNLGFARVAVPYDILSKREDPLEMMAANRIKVVNNLISQSPIGFIVHLLGMTTLGELKQHNRGWVKSIDTGSPVLHGLNLLQFPDDPYIPKNEPTMNRMDLHWEEGEVPNLDLVYYNIAYLRKTLNDSGLR